MAIGTPFVFTQADDTDNTSATMVLPITAAVTAPATGYVIIGGEDAALTGALTDSKSNTWTALDDGTATAGGSPIFGATWRGNITTSLTTSDTLSFTKSAAGNRPHAFAGIAWTGSSSTHEVKAENNGTGTALSSGTTASTTTANALAVASFAIADNLAVTPGGSYVERAEQGASGGGTSTPHVQIETLLLSATGTQSGTATRAAGIAAWVGFIAVFPESGGAPATKAIVFPGRNARNALLRR